MTLRNSGMAALLLAAAATPAMADSLTERANRGLVEVITGSVNGSAARMAEDLADVLDDGATRRVLPVIGKGSLQDLVDLQAVRGIDFAIVQTDVLDYAKGQRLLQGNDGALTYVARLDNEEVHVLARGDIASVADLAGLKVNFGGPGDGTSVIAPRLFNLLKVKVEPTAYGQALALEKLRSGEIAAMVFVAGKPAPLFAGLTTRDGVHLLAIPLKSEIAWAYSPARLTAEDYPGLLPASGAVDTVAVGTVLMAANLMPDTDRYRNAANFVEAFFTQFPKLLEAPHHPKWRDVNLAAELPGWRRFAPADAWLTHNGGAGTAMTEAQMREIFIKFLDERSKVSGGTGLSSNEKDQLFGQFKRWQSAQH